MLIEARQQAIYEVLRRRGSARTTELSDELGISQMTIRRDLNALARRGLVRRLHGGAALTGPPNALTSTGAGAVAELPRKMAIAREAFAFLVPDQVLYLDGSTTCRELAKLLPNDLGLRVVTDSLDTVLELHARAGVEVTLLGGVLQRKDRVGNTFAGSLALENAAKIGVDLCFSSACAFAEDHIGNPDMAGVEVRRSMLRNARRRFLLADSTKYGKRGYIELCTWREVDVLVTDEGLTAQRLEGVAAQDVEILIAALGVSAPQTP